MCLDGGGRCFIVPVMPELGLVSEGRFFRASRWFFFKLVEGRASAVTCTCTQGPGLDVLDLFFSIEMT